MKNFCIIVLFIFSSHIIYATPAYIFAISATEDIADDVLNSINLKLAQMSKNPNFTLNNNDNLSINKREVTHSQMFINRRGVISLPKENTDTPSKLTIFKPNDFFADINDGNQKTIIIRPAKRGIINLNPESLMYILFNYDLFIQGLREYSAVNEKTELQVSNDIVQYSDGIYNYILLLKNGRIGSIEIHTHSSGELFSDVSLEYVNQKSLFPEKIMVRIYQEGKIKMKKEFLFKLEKEFIQNLETDSLFNTDNLGMYKFVDMRFSPIKTYNYDNGIPSYENASVILDIMKFKDISKQTEVELESVRSGFKSAYITKIEDFFKVNK